MPVVRGRDRLVCPGIVYDCAALGTCRLDAGHACTESRERFLASGTEPGASTPDQLRERIEREFVRYEALLTQLGLRGR
jgi:hypothetical protein